MSSRTNPSERERETKIHMVGGQQFDDLKQFRLVRLPAPYSPEPKTLASLCVKRNIVFGTKLHVPNERGFVKTCLPLLRKGLVEAGIEGGK